MDYKVEYEHTDGDVVVWVVDGYFGSLMSAVMHAFEDAYESESYGTRVLANDVVVAEFKPMRNKR